MLNVLIDENPTIDLFIDNVAVFDRKRKTEARRKKGASREAKRKRVGSAAVQTTKQKDFGKTFARQQIVQHLNVNQGVSETIAKVARRDAKPVSSRQTTDSEQCPALVPISNPVIQEESLQAWKPLALQKSKSDGKLSGVRMSAKSRASSETQLRRLQ